MIWSTRVNTLLYERRRTKPAPTSPQVHVRLEQQDGDEALVAGADGAAAVRAVVPGPAAAGSVVGYGIVSAKRDVGVEAVGAVEAVTGVGAQPTHRQLRGRWGPEAEAVAGAVEAIDGVGAKPAHRQLRGRWTSAAVEAAAGVAAAAQSRRWVAAQAAGPGAGCAGSCRVSGTC